MSTVIEDQETPIWALTDAGVTSELASICVARSRLDARAAVLVQAAADRGLARLSGASNLSTWLKNLTGMSRAEAHRTVKRSELLCDVVEETRVAWASGAISTDQATVICETLTSLPDWVGDEATAAAQDILLGWAGECSHDELKIRSVRILEMIDPDGVDEHLGKKLEAEEKDAFTKTSLTFINAGDGMTRLRGMLPNVQAGILRAALEGIASPRRNSPRIYDRDGAHTDAAVGTLTHDMKLGRAMCELIEHLPADAMPQHGGLAATVTIDVDIQALRDQIGAATLSTGDLMSAAQARRFACNANLLPIVLDGKSRILDQGQSQRLFDKNQRIALAKRDRGCVWMGCDRPPAWCEAHHPDPWSNGGPTDLANGALFCFFHHHLLHSGEWECRMASVANGQLCPEVIPPKMIDSLQKPMRHDRFRSGP